jgi:hypothetical protein
MKVRTGFVSNSSSSSFVVVFPKIHANKKELRKMLFGNDEYYSAPYGDETYSVNKVTNTVWDDMKKQCPNDVVSIMSEMEGYSTYDDPKAPAHPYDVYDHNDFTAEDWTKLCDEHHKAEEKYRLEKIRKLMNKHKNEFIYTFQYSDNDGNYFSALEHGYLFDNLKHIKISHH